MTLRSSGKLKNFPTWKSVVRPPELKPATRFCMHVCVLHPYVSAFMGVCVCIRMHVRGVRVVSIVSVGSHVCIAYTSVLVNSSDPRHILGYVYEYSSVEQATKACTRHFQ